MEHLVNTSAKWRDVHNNKGVSMVVRGLVGRGWGQGPNHSQAFHAMFAHVPGLRVLYPVNPEKVSYWMNEALNCGSPTVILEPRRVYEFETLDIQEVANPDIYIVTFGDVVLDAVLAAQELGKAGVKAQVHPIEDVTAMEIPETYLPVVICDTGHLFCGATAEVAAQLAERGNARIKRVGPPFVALPTSMPLEKEWYPSVGDIVVAANQLLDLSVPIPETVVVGDRAFRGPF
jgi:pyruvate/2-oxoglutarate/acetoin dehydrogenase E1 component